MLRDPRVPVGDALEGVCDPHPICPGCDRQGRIRRHLYYRRVLQVLERTPKIFPGVLGQESQLFLGRDFFPWMLVAFGAALVAGNALAWFRPPPAAGGRRPPLSRTLVMVALGALLLLWGVASLVAGD